MTRVEVKAYITPAMEGKIMLSEDILNHIGAYVTIPCRVASRHIEVPKGELLPIDEDGDLHEPNIMLLVYVEDMAKAQQLKNYLVAVARPQDQIIMSAVEVTANIFSGMGLK